MAAGEDGGWSEPLLVSALGAAGLWLLLPTMRHHITQHPATATPLLQSPPRLGTGANPCVATCPAPWRQVVQ